MPCSQNASRTACDTVALVSETPRGIGVTSDVMPAQTRSKVFRKFAVGVVVLAGLGYLFAYTLETSLSEPYTVEQSRLGPWTLVIEPAAGPNAPLLSLRTGQELVSDLFRQLFQRKMESMNTPTTASIPIVLHAEFERGLAGRMTFDDLLAAAREAGLESPSHVPSCLAHRRISEPGQTRQIYFVSVDSPGIVAFRAALAQRGQGAFDAAAVTPVMFVGATDPAFARWLPIRATEADCISPVTITP